MKCRICEKEIGNDFQSVCKKCTEKEDAIDECEDGVWNGLD